MTEPTTLIRGRYDVYKAWDHKSVVVKEQAVGSTIVYPRLGRGVRYRGFTLREDYVLARLRSLDEAIHWCQHHFYDYSIMGRRPLT